MERQMPEARSMALSAARPCAAIAAILSAWAAVAQATDIPALWRSNLTSASHVVRFGPEGLRPEGATTTEFLEGSVAVTHQVWRIQLWLDTEGSAITAAELFRIPTFALLPPIDDAAPSTD